MIKSAPITDKNYYAVRPELVLRAAKLFAVTPAMLEKGAKKLYSRAVSVSVGKQSGRWGRHQKLVLEQFCEYTQMTGSDLLLPWQELVESSMNYDGKEGISPRTGNRPLSTLMRVEVNKDKLRAQRAKLNIELEELSRLSTIPVPLLKAMESGEWSDVAESTAKVISETLKVSTADLFTSMGLNSPSLNKAKSDDATEIELEKSGSVVYKKIVLTLISILLLAGVWWFVSLLPEPDKPNSGSNISINEQQVINSRWHAIIVLNNNNIPIDDKIKELWSNGIYIKLKEDNIIAYSWIETKSFIDLPNTKSNWRVEGESLIIDLDGIVYKFLTPKIKGIIETLNTTRAFKITMYPIT